jgi:hypothetical protein
LRLNGTLSYRWDAPAPIDTGAGPTALVGSAPWDETRGWFGEIAEIIILQVSPTPEQTKEIERYLAGKWGIGLPP